MFTIKKLGLRPNFYVFKLFAYLALYANNTESWCNYCSYECATPLDVQMMNCSLNSWGRYQPAAVTMRRLNKKKALNFVKELDAFPKVPESYVETTASGGTGERWAEISFVKIMVCLNKQYICARVCVSVLF